VRFAEHDQALPDEATGERRGACRDAASPRLAAAGDDAALDLDQVLQGDRDAVQRPNGVTGANRLFGRFRRQSGVLGIDLHKGLELWLPHLDAREIDFDEVDRREPPGLDRGGQLVDGENGRIALQHRGFAVGP